MTLKCYSLKLFNIFVIPICSISFTSNSSPSSSLTSFRYTSLCLCVRSMETWIGTQLLAFLTYKLSLLYVGCESIFAIKSCSEIFFKDSVLICLWIWFNRIKMTLDVAEHLFYVGVFYVLNIFILNPYLEQLKYELL